jgi:surfactin synthase thioesterase subunit/acyl carrier protein
VLAAGEPMAVVAPIRDEAFAALGSDRKLPQILRGLRAFEDKPSNTKLGDLQGTAEEKQAAISRAILQEVASVLDVKPGSLDQNRRLDELGMDSLMALELTHRLETEYGVTLTRSADAVVPTVDSLIQAAWQRFGISGESVTPTTNVSPDVARLHRLGPPAGSPAGEGASALICFCWAGGNRAGYRGWQRRLPGTNIFVAELNRSTNDARETSVQQIANSIAERVRELVRPGVVLFGHSFGALLAYEVVRILDAELSKAGASLIVSGRDAPHLPGAAEDLTALDDAALAERIKKFGGTPVEVAGDDEFFALSLAAVRYDLTLARSYSAVPGPKLRCPIVVIGGRTDPTTTPRGLQAWSDYTIAPVRPEIFDGGHFYFRESEDAFFRVLRSRLGEATVQSAVSG